MITLYGFGPGLGMYDPSPFVLKVAAFLRLANIDYRFNGNVNHVFKAPKKKPPYLNDNGTIVYDSTFIISHLKDRYVADFDSHLSLQQQATATFVSKSLDATVYAFLAEAILVELDSALTRLARQYLNLNNYCQRIQQQYFAR